MEYISLLVQLLLFISTLTFSLSGLLKLNHRNTVQIRRSRKIIIVNVT